ncbi:hypothetical protein [Kushneria phyllosphaerae]|uniref:Uncharacterized protein n=1 Tax=Kushneria phyllosphaerae TaxID=2100822 RepID=A0A2R8CKN9_9GAMM|nr:hypothetical protein [Kushneria phyllosphaerae]SPJ33467.1 hypothetical protein KSP9073_01476 [Kushneria phyllosphaerae]
MIDPAKSKEISNICHIMDLQVSGHMNIVQAEKYWQGTIERVDRQVLAEALSEGLIRYEMRSTDKGRAADTTQPDQLPGSVRSVCLGLVTSRMIQLRPAARSPLAESELEELIPVAEWLLERGGSK